MIKIGMLIADRYEVLEKTGTGGMSVVYRAKDHKLNRTVAIKVLKQEFSDNANFVSKFRVEAQAAAGLMHPNIVNVYDVGEEKGMYYIVMEYVDGITLKKYIEKKSRLTAKEAISIAIQVSLGLQAAHANHVIHRDIKPQNIMISRDGKVKVTDFGIAKAATSNTITSNVMGSVHYTSPEQARGGYSDERSDIYSLGISLFEMLTGRVPFNGETTVAIAIKHIQSPMPSPREFVPDVPRSVEQIVLKCCEKSPDRRYQNMNELIGDLKQSLIHPNDDFVKIIDPDEDGATRMANPVAQAKARRKADGAAAAAAAVHAGTVPADNGNAPEGENVGESERNYAADQVPPYPEQDYPHTGYSEKEYRDRSHPERSYESDPYEADAGYEGNDYRGAAYPEESYRENAYREEPYAEQTYPEEQYAAQDYEPESYPGEAYGDRPQRGRGSYDEREFRDRRSARQSRQERIDAPLRKNSRYDDPYETSTHRGNYDPGREKLITVISIAVALAIGAVIILFAASKMGFLSSAGEGDKAEETLQSSIVLPEMVGKNAEEVQNSLKSLGLIPEVIYEESDEYDSGIVMSAAFQDGTVATAGAGVEAGTNVILKVSAGQSGVEVPDVTGKSQAEAIATLKQKGFDTINKVDGVSNDVEKGQVISQSPIGGALAPADTAVTLTICTGPDTEGQIQVPSLTGRTIEEAMAILTEKGLTLGSTKEVDTTDDAQVGKVIAQNVEADSYVDPGTEVTLTVGKKAKAATYSYSGEIAAPTAEEAPDYVAGSQVYIVIITADGQTLMNTVATTFPQPAAFTGISCATGTLQMSYASSAADAVNGQRVITRQLTFTPES